VEPDLERRSRDGVGRIVLGLAQRLPTREVVALPPNAPFPKALAGEWRYVRVELPEAGLTTVNGLPSWTLEGLIVGIAARPSAYKDVGGLGQWLPEAAAYCGCPHHSSLCWRGCVLQLGSVLPTS